jgi:2-polyprenyl-3-methyl-5-hydroxy-6-metoxy-1,4-benzoquinol methylase
MAQPAQWDRERAFFDAQASQVRQFDFAALAARYERARSRPIYPLECALALLGDVRGKRVLDVGCGLGGNSLLLAHWGAIVHGIDISPQSVSIATQRAAMLGLSARATFEATPFESVAASGREYDIIWSAAFLHHVLDRLPEVLTSMRTMLASGGSAVLLEPVRLSRALRRVLRTLRGIVPGAAASTPDERPLEPQDLALIESQFELRHRRCFGIIGGGVSRYLLRGGYERSPRPLREFADACWRIDSVLANSRIGSSITTVMLAKMMPRPEPR